MPNRAAQAMNAELKKLAASMTFPSGRPDTSQRFKTATGAVKSRTFTAKPPVERARRIPRSDYTHNPTQLTNIANETRSLVARLQHVYQRPGAPAGDVRATPPPRLPNGEAHQARNRCGARHVESVVLLVCVFLIESLRCHAPLGVGLEQALGPTVASF